MIKSYYFRHNEMKAVLAPVYATTEEEAWDLLEKDHTWCNATRNNCMLYKVFDGTTYSRIQGR